MSETGASNSRFAAYVKALAAVLAGLSISLLGAGLFLRSETGEKILFKKLAQVLAEQGFILNAAEFSGPLPGRLHLRGLSLADAEGTFFTVDDAELRLEPLALLDGLIHIESVSLARPRLWKLPPARAGEPEKESGEPEMPLALRLEELSVRNGLIGGQVFAPASENAPLGFNLAGSAHIGMGAISASDLGAVIRLEISDLAALAPELSGPLTLDAEAGGKLAALALSASLASPRLDAPEAFLENALFKLSLSGAISAPDMGGDFSLAAESPLGPLAAASSWSFKNEGGISAALSELKGALGPINLSGDVALDLKGEKPLAAGFLKLETADFSPLALAAGQPFSGGPARFELKLSDEGGQSLNAFLDVPALRLAGEKSDIFSLADARASVEARDLFGKMDLTADIALGPGLAGSAKWGGARFTAEGRAGQGVFSLDLKALALSFLGGADRDGLKVAGAYNLNEKSLEINALELALASAGLKLRGPAALAFGENMRLSPTSLAISPAGSLDMEADLSPGQTRLSARLAALPLSFLKNFLPPETFMPEGQVETLALDLKEGPEGLAGTFDLAAGLSHQELSSAIQAHGDLKDNIFKVNGRILGGSGWDAGGDFSASFHLTGLPEGSPPGLDMDAPLDASLSWSGDVAPLWKLAGQPDRRLTGRATIEAREPGSLARSKFAATVNLEEGRYEDLLLGLLLSDINLSAEGGLLSSGAQLSAGDGRGGSLSLSARLEKGGKGPEILAEGRLASFAPLYRDDIKLSLSGDVGAKGPLSRPQLTSDLSVDRGEIDLKVLLASQSVPTLEIAEKGEVEARGRGPRLAMNIKAPNQFFIRGYGLDSEWRGDLKVGGLASRPSLTGSLKPVRGVFEIFSREFSFDGGDISFNGGVDPSLNLELSNSGPNIMALIKITGRGTAPALVMESRPPGPQEEVLAQVLFGKRASELSRFEALQLAAGLRELMSFGQGSFSFDPVGDIRRGLGLDVLRVGDGRGGGERSVSDLSGSMAEDVRGGGGGGAAETGGGSLEAGKYISDKVYMGVEQSSSGSSAVRVEMELSPNISLEARTSTESSRVGIGWRKDY